MLCRKLYLHICLSALYFIHLLQPPMCLVYRLFHLKWSPQWEVQPPPCIPHLYWFNATSLLYHLVVITGPRSHAISTPCDLWWKSLAHFVPKSFSHNPHLCLSRPVWVDLWTFNWYGNWIFLLQAIHFYFKYPCECSYLKSPFGDRKSEEQNSHLNGSSGCWFWKWITKDCCISKVCKQT